MNFAENELANLINPDPSFQMVKRLLPPVIHTPSAPQKVVFSTCVIKQPTIQTCLLYFRGANPSEMYI